MGRQSKATISRLSNLQKSKNTHIPTFNDVFDEEDTISDDEDFPDHGFFLPDEGISHEEDSEDSDSDDDEEFDEEELNELQNEADIDHFKAVLAHAQAMAVKAEREAAGEKPKRKRHYTGNSDRTKRHHAQKRRKLEATGQKLISSMIFTKKAKEPTAHITEANQEQQIFDDLDLEDLDGDEIDASLKELFPGQLEGDLEVSSLKE